MIKNRSAVRIIFKYDDVHGRLDPSHPPEAFSRYLQNQIEETEREGNVYDLKARPDDLKRLFRDSFENDFAVHIAGISKTVITATVLEGTDNVR